MLLWLSILFILIIGFTIYWFWLNYNPVKETFQNQYDENKTEYDNCKILSEKINKNIQIINNKVVEADIYQSRWYWADRRVASATRTIRLAYQPLTRRWRVNIVTGLINNSAGLRATLNQNYDSLTEALSAVQRLSRWRIADNAEVDPDVIHKLEFSFRLDLSQLPRPFQIGVAGQRDWTIAVQQSERLQLGLARPSAALSDKTRAAAP